MSKEPRPDIIMCPSFFKDVKNGPPIFKGGKAIILLHIPNDIYHSYEDWIGEREMENLQSGPFSNKMLDKCLSSKTRKTAKGRKRTFTEAMEASVYKPIPPAAISASSTSPTTSAQVIDLTVSKSNSPSLSKNSPPSKCARLGHKSLQLNEPLSPMKALASDVALRAQTQPSAHDVRFLFQSTKSIHVLVYLVKHPGSFIDLLTIPDWKMYFNGSPLDIRLHLNMSPSDRKKGGFKLAYFGTASQPLFGGDTAVCAKQSFYTKTKAVMRHGDQAIPTEIRQDIPYDGIKQVQDLTMELTCLNWAHALLEMVYAFVEKRLEKSKVSELAGTITIPRMRFVQAGLAIEQGDKNAAERRCFLLEEVIPKKEGFRKYLNNVSAVPCKLSTDEDLDRASFLSFAQHVQYFKTNKRAYVSDFQGGTTLLTDPQIVTNGKLGLIFAEGNLPHAFNSFEEDHRCNKFCDYFSLPTDYNHWEVDSDDGDLN